jgi:hypothetical protein
MEPWNTLSLIHAQTMDRLMATGFEDRRNAQVARVFFEATTNYSLNPEDILPQEGGGMAAGDDDDLSVFKVFAMLFPEVVGAAGARGVCESVHPTCQ